DHRSDAARRRRRAGRFQAFAMLGPRFAGEDAAVDQAGRQHQPAAVHHFGIVRFGIVEQTRADIGDAAILDQQAALGVQPAGRINQACVAEGDAPVHAMPRESASRIAMRMATPISTCSAMTLTSTSSAMSEAISTPRFIGPGCITSAPGLAWLSFS